MEDHPLMHTVDNVERKKMIDVLRICAIQNKRLS